MTCNGMLNKSYAGNKLFGAQAGICTQVRGFAVRCIATLPPMLWPCVTDLMFEDSSLKTTI